MLIASLVIASMPGVVRRMLPPMPRLRDKGLLPQVVVVPGGGRQYRDGRMQPSAATLRRALKGAIEARDRQLPLLFTGGGAGKVVPGESEAALMASAIRHDWPDAPLLLEEDSRNTWESARLTAALLHNKNISRVLLVTDAVHMPRAVMSFRRHGLEVIPATVPQMAELPWMPSAGALGMLIDAWYEWLALAWYQIRHF